jgi:hypothetical protein
LQRNDRWEDAAWLAKVSLEPKKCSVIYKQWALHLAKGDPQHPSRATPPSASSSSEGAEQKMQAVFISLTLGEFHLALQLLYDLGMVDTAALFVRALQEKNLLDTETKQTKEMMLDALANNVIPLEQLLLSIHLDFGFFAHRLEVKDAAEYYWKMAGSAGENMIESMRAVSIPFLL